MVEETLTDPDQRVSSDSPAKTKEAGKQGPHFDFDTGSESDRGSRDRLISILSPVALLLLWELLAQLGWIDVRFFPAPSAVMLRLIEMVSTGALFGQLEISLYRVIIGFFAGAVPALILGLTMGLFPVVRAAFEPIVAALYPIPQLALLPLWLIVFGVGETFKIVTIAFGCFFLIVLNTMAGVVNIPKIYLDVARDYGASRRDFYLTVALPGALPTIFTGLKLGMGVALLLIVAAEMIGANQGIGYMIWTSYEIFDPEQMYVGLIMMALLGYLFTASLNWLENWIIPWREDNRGGV